MVELMSPVPLCSWDAKKNTTPHVLNGNFFSVLFHDFSYHNALHGTVDPSLSYTNALVLAGEIMPTKSNNALKRKAEEFPDDVENKVPKNLVRSVSDGTDVTDCEAQ